MIAKILIDLNVFKSDMGMLIMSAAMLNDMIGWMGFAVVLALIAPEAAVDPAVVEGAAEVVKQAESHGRGVGETLLLTLGFLALMMTVVRWGIHRLMPLIQAHWS